MHQPSAQMRSIDRRRLLAAAAALCGLAILLGLAFAGWSIHGAGILAAAWEAGLAWCL